MPQRQGRRTASAVSGAALAGLLLVLAGCTGGRFAGEVHTANPPPNPQADSASALEQLETQLGAALTALGKDSSKMLAATATGADNAVFDLALQVSTASGSAASSGSSDATHVRLRWTERCAGDYDQNGEVNLADLVPLSRFLRRSVSYDDPELHAGLAHWPSGDPESFPLGEPPANNWLLARVDGDGNGEINAADLLMIARHWGEQLDGYVVERGINRGQGELEWEVATISSSYLPRQATAAGYPACYDLLLPLSEANLAQSYRVRGWSNNAGQALVCSNMALYLPDAATDSTAPVWDSTVGVQGLLPDDGELAVQFGSASDSQSPPVIYRVFWLASFSGSTVPFDYSSAHWADTLNQHYTITGLDNQTYYRVAVRTRDCAVPANFEENTIVLGRNPGPRDKYPPHWDGEHSGIANLFFGNGNAIVSWEEAFDHAQDSHGVWNSGPPNYRLYYGPGTEPDFANASVIKIASNGMPAYVRPVSEIDTSIPHWFAVRAIDRAEFPNQDENTNYRIGWPTQSRLIQTGLPEAGPAVPPSATVVPVTRFAFNAQRSAARLCIESYSAEDRWLSLYEVGESSFNHSGDYCFSSGHANPQYRLHAIQLDELLHPRLLFTRSKALGGPHLLAEYHGSSGLTVEFSVDSGPDLLCAEYGPDSKLHGLWLTLDNPDFANLQFSTFYSGLPFSTTNLVHSTSSDTERRFLTVPAQSWCWLDDGSKVMLSELVSLTSDQRIPRLLTIRADGSSVHSPAPIPLLGSGQGNLRLARGGGERIVSTDWGSDDNGRQVAYLRQRWNTRKFSNEPGLTQLYLAHPAQGPCLRAIDMDNFVVARTFSTTLQAGSGGSERLHSCLHARWAGRETIIPLPFLQDGDYLFPLELLPGNLLLSRVETPLGQRCLILRLPAAQ